jgi:hypothetical protein
MSDFYFESGTLFDLCLCGDRGAHMSGFKAQLLGRITALLPGCCRLSWILYMIARHIRHFNFM